MIFVKLVFMVRQVTVQIVVIIMYVSANFVLNLQKINGGKLNSSVEWNWNSRDKNLIVAFCSLFLKISYYHWFPV